MIPMIQKACSFASDTNLGIGAASSHWHRSIVRHDLMTRLSSKRIG